MDAAKLDEIERNARMARQTTYLADNDEVRFADGDLWDSFAHFDTTSFAVDETGSLRNVDAKHIANCDPATVLALVAAARESIALRALIEAHNTACESECKARHEHGTLCAALERCGGRRCSDCPRDYLIDLSVPASAAQPGEEPAP